MYDWYTKFISIEIKNILLHEINMMLCCMKNKISILYYEPTSGYGGSARCLLGWLKHLDTNRFSPIIFLHYYNNGPALQEIKKLGFEIKYIYLKRYAFNKLPGLLKIVLNFILFYLPVALIFAFYTIKRKIKILHLNCIISGVIPGIIASIITGVPCICHIHDSSIPSKFDILWGRFVDVFITLTDKGKEMYRALFPNKKVIRIYNGIESSLNINETEVKKIKTSFNIPDNWKVVGIIGRILPGKGFDDFIQAAKLVKEKVPNSKFVIVGNSICDENSEEQKLKQMVRYLNLHNDVIFAGWQDDIQNFISFFDVLVQASSYYPEGFGLTCIEGMRQSKPLVVTNIPGPSEIVVNNQTGFIVTPQKPNELSEAIIKIIENPELAERFGKFGKERFESLFTIDKTVTAIQGLYVNLVK